MAGKIPSRTNKAHNAKPYDRPKSFFQKVASTLCDMFVPSWMLYDSSQNNNANQKTEQVEEQSSQNVLRSDLNQPLPESSYIPERRPCCSSYAADLKERKEKPKEFEFSSGHRSENAEENIPSSIKTDILSTNYVFQRKSSVRHPIVNGDDHSENSEGSASTSGCSSLVSSHQERRDQIHDPGLQISEEGLERISKKLTEKQLFKRRTEKRDISVETDSVCQETEGNVSTSHTPLWFEDRSLNPSKRARPQPSATGRRPSFSLSSFGAPPLSDSRNAANKTYSPFYEGKTVFGGASSNRKMQLFSSVPYQYTRPQNARLNVKEAASSKKEFDYMSTTAKRILQSLEKMSTPLEDAKKIPAEGKTIELAFAARHRMMPSIMALKRQSIRPSERGPPTKSVLIPSPTIIGKNLEPRISPSIEKKKNDIRTENSSFNTFTTQCSSAPAGGKLKTRAHSSMHQSRKQDSEEVVEIPDLPSVPLPVAQLPTFNFSTLSKGPTKSTASVTNNGTLSSQPIFTFSSPVEHNVPSSSQIPYSSEASFTFSSPVIKDKTIESATSTLLVQNAKHSTKEEECHSVEPSSELIIGGSVMDVLGKSESKVATSISDKKPNTDDKLKEEIKTEQKEITDLKQEKITISGFGDKFKPEPGSWECTSCLLRNKESAEKCVSCNSPNPKLNSLSTVTSEAGGFKVFSTPFSSDSVKWEVSSTSAENKCSIMASEISKPKNNASWQGFGDKFKPVTDSWNCPSCMINNSNSLQQCAACGTSKPQSSKSPLAPQASVASFGNKFKPPPGTWNCDTCFVPNSADVTKCDACETPRVAISQIKDPKQAFSGFKFSLPEKQSTSTNNTIKFGIPVTNIINGSEATTGFKLGKIVAESKSTESLNFGMSASSHNMPSNTCVFGNKPLEKISEPVSTSVKVETGFTIPTNNNISSNFTFGQKLLPVSTPEKTNLKFGVQHNNQELKSANEEVVSVPNSLLLNSTVTSALPSTSLSSPKLSASLTTVTTTVSVFNFGKSPPIMSTTSSEIVLPNSSEENTAALPKATSTAFSFASASPRSDTSICEGNLQKTNEETKVSLFGTTKPAVGLKPDIGQSIKPEIEQKPNIVQSTPSTFNATSNVQFSFGTNTKNSSAFVFGTPKTESSQRSSGGFTFAIGSGKPTSDKSVTGFTSFGAGSTSQAATTSTFAFGSGAQVSNVTTTTAAAVTTSSPNMFSFGTYSTQPTVSAKPDATPQTSASLFSASPQISLPSFGSALSTPTFGQQSQLKQEGFVFQQPSQGLRFGNTTTAPIFRFGAPQEQKPAGFTFGASQEPEQKTIEIPPQKPAFSFGFSSPQAEQKPAAVPQDGNFMFAGNSQSSNEQEKPKSGFNFAFNPPQQAPVFGTALSTTTITGTVPTFNFTGNTPTAAAFSFSASPSNTPSSSTPGSRRIKRAVRRSVLGSGRRD